jgi:cytochrome c oxidase assembly protein subunit 15
MPDISQNDRTIMRWLQFCLFLIFAMIILGGVTRLTGSGLSMVNWHPTGMLPPLTAEQWLQEFYRYQQFPEFKVINQGMTIDGFKSIYWFEYSHRMLGRLIGLVFFLPLVYFWSRKTIKTELKPRLIILFLLGGFQGLLGWYMVKSGLVNDPQVSQYRLSAHLMSAILIYGFMMWTIFDLANPEKYRSLVKSDQPGWRKISLALMTLLLITMVTGGFAAGLKAGLIFNTFPLMGGQLVPEGIGALSPWYLNLLENRVTVQFDHRWLATLSGVALIGWYIKGRSSFDNTKLQRSFKWVGMMVIIQLALGIATLLAQVPVLLGVLHQAGALLLFSALLFNTHSLSRV